MWLCCLFGNLAVSIAFLCMHWNAIREEILSIQKVHIIPLLPPNTELLKT